MPALSLPVVAVAMAVLVALGCALLVMVRFALWNRRQGLFSQRADGLTPSLAADEAQRLLSELHRLATELAEEVAQHSTRIQYYSRQLAEAPQQRDAPTAPSLRESVQKLIEANTVLQVRLDSARLLVEEQAQSIHSQLDLLLTDSLTGIANRRALDEELSRQVSHPDRGYRPLSLLMVDVDRFKLINDAYGHQVGDTVLRGVAQAITRSICGTHTAARYGGDEFAVILPGMGLEQARLVAHRIQEGVAAGEIPVADSHLGVTVSLGVAELLNGETQASLVRRADAALYASKQSGRNCGHLHSGAALERLRLEMPTASCRPGARARQWESQSSPTPPHVAQNDSP